MDRGVKVAGILGLVVGVFLGVGFSAFTGNWWCLLLIPVCAVMAAATQYVNPKTPEE